MVYPIDHPWSAPAIRPGRLQRRVADSTLWSATCVATTRWIPAVRASAVSRAISGLDLLAETLYQVHDLVYDDNKVQHLVSSLAEILDVSTSGSGKLLQTLVHLAYKPAENIHELGTIGYHGECQMRQCRVL